MKSVEVTMKFLVEVDDAIEINELDSRLVVCFYHEDTYGTEHFLPKADGLTITEYLDTKINSVTQNELSLNLELYHAKCDECGSGMNEGYCIFGGHYYYCSDECLHKHYTEEEWLDLYDDDGDSYWTEWECEEDANYKLVNGELIEL